MPKLWQGHQWCQVYTATAMCWKCSSEVKLPVLQSSVQFGLTGDRSWLEQWQWNALKMTSQIRGKTNDPITFNDHIHNIPPLKESIVFTSAVRNEDNVRFNWGTLENVVCVFDSFLKGKVHSNSPILSFTHVTQTCLNLFIL